MVSARVAAPRIGRRKTGRSFIGAKCKTSHRKHASEFDFLPAGLDPVSRIILPLVTPTLLNTAGEPERDARTRHWNAIEAITFCFVILIALWPVAYGLVVLG